MRRRIRVLISRALLVAGGTVAGTAAAWALAGGTAAAAEHPAEHPAEHVLSTVHSRHADPLTDLSDLTNEAGTRLAHDIGSTVRHTVHTVRPVLDETTRQLGHAVDPVLHPERHRDDLGKGVRTIVGGVGGALDGIGKLGKHVVPHLPTGPVTAPAHRPHSPIYTAPSRSPQVTTVTTGQHARHADHSARHVARPRLVTVTGTAAPHLPAGGAQHRLPHRHYGGSPEAPVAPRMPVGGAGSDAAHDGPAYGGVAGAYAIAPRITPPVVRAAARPAGDRGNVRIAEQPGTTPD